MNKARDPWETGGLLSGALLPRYQKLLENQPIRGQSDVAAVERRSRKVATRCLRS